MNTSLAGRRALVTGGSRGLGSGIVTALARAGADVGIVYRKQKDEAETVAEQVRALGRRAVLAQADVADCDAVECAFSKVASELGGLEIVVANAGIASPNVTIADMPVDRWRKIMAVDLDGAFFTAKTAAPHLMEAGHRGSIVFVSTVGSLRGTPTQSPYAASKAAVNSLGRTFALELAAYGARSNVVAPGIFATDMTRVIMERADLASTVPLGRIAQPRELGQVVTWLCSDDASYVTGELIRVDGGLYG